MSGQISEPESVIDGQWGNDTITVLHVDDKPAFTEVCADLLEREGDRLGVETATSATEGLDYIAEEPPDCIVSDYDMPGMNGLEFLGEVRKTHSDLPFILFTGKGSEEIASEAISAGVTDYLQKSGSQNQYRILRNRIENSVGNYRSQRSLQLFRLAVEHSGHSIYITDSDGVIEYVNPSFTETTGYTPEEAIGRTPRILNSGEHPTEFYADLWETILDGKVWESEITNRRKGGELYVAEQTIAPIFVEDDGPEKFVAVNQDITDQKKHQFALEKQCDDLEILNRMFRHHIRDDLQIVTGYTELLEEHVNSEGEAHLRTLKERSWDVSGRAEATGKFADILQQTEPDRSMKLDEIIESAVQNVGWTDKDVSITVGDEDSSMPVVPDMVLGSIIRILIEMIVRREGTQTSQLLVTADQGSDDFSLQVTTNGQATSDGEPAPDTADVFGFEGSEMSTPELYIIQGFLKEHGGEITVTRDRAERIKFALKFPLPDYCKGGSSGGDC